MAMISLDKQIEFMRQDVKYRKVAVENPGIRSPEWLLANLASAESVLQTLTQLRALGAGTGNAAPE